MVFSASKAGVRVESGEVGCEDGSANLAAIGAVADEGIDQSRGLEGLGRELLS